MSETKTKKPVEVSPEAIFDLSQMVRRWSGWPDARLTLGKPEVGRIASTNHITHHIMADPEQVLLNPNRVLLTVTPFRLRQEAVLTGALLHEAAHARFTHWKPRTEEQVERFVHSDKSPVTRQEFALADLMEEARIEGLLTRDASRLGVAGLEWTVRAMAAHAIPASQLDTDPDQRIMDVIQSWALRAGRRYAIHQMTPMSRQGRLPHWVHQYNDLLLVALVAHLTDTVGLVSSAADASARKVIGRLLDMAVWDGEQVKYLDHTGPFMVDTAAEVLDILFPNTDGDSEDAAMPSVACSAPPPESGENEDESDEQDSGEGESDPEADDAGDGDEGSDEDSDEDSDGDGDADDGDADDGDADDGDESDDNDGDADDGDADGDESEEDGDDGATDSTDDDESEGDDDSLAQELAALEAAAASAEDHDVKQEADRPAMGAGSGPGETTNQQGWRNPTALEREVQKEAETFLRGVIEPSESTQVTLSESPAATVDGAALSAWKAGGQVRAPHFFRVTRREVEPSPPVRIAVLVDVSASMSVLQHPSSLLSWALAAAAFDLRNFAGRGQQIESCLIHWGGRAEVIQKNGEMMPGLRIFDCNQNTSALHMAMRLVEEQMPGFFEPSEKPINRLLVQFTDWELGGSTIRPSTEYLSRALEAGVNMLSVVPPAYSERSSILPGMLAVCPVQRGRSTVLRYNPNRPGQVWDEASRALSR